MSYRNRKEGWTISSHWWVSTSNASHSVLRLMISDKLATMLTALDASKDLLLLDISTLSPPSPATLGCICAKFSQMMTTITQQWVLPGYERLSATYMWPLLKMIKSVLCLVSEYGWWFRILMDVIRMWKSFSFLGPKYLVWDKNCIIWFTVFLTYMVWDCIF